MVQPFKCRPKYPPLVYVLTFLSATGGFLFGYDTGVVSGAMLLIRDEFDLDNKWHEIIVSITIGAAWVFSLSAGYLTDIFGRKRVIVISSVIFTVGAILMGASMNKETLLVGRVVVGIAIGLVSMAVPVYIAEASPPSIRGKLVIQNQIFITAGLLGAALICGFFSKVPQGWRYMLAIGGVPSLLQFIGFLYMPESPRWLVAQGRNEEALTVLKTLRPPMSSNEAEIQDIENSYHDTRLMVKDNFPIRRIFTTPTTRRALLLGCSLQLFQQLSGINTVMYYSASIIQMAGIKDKSQAIWLATITSTINFVCAFVGLYLVERVGRRVLTLFSTTGVLLSLILLGLSFQIVKNDSPQTQLNETLEVDMCSNFKNCFECVNEQACGFCMVKHSALTYATGSCVLASEDKKSGKYGRCAGNDTIGMYLNFTRVFDEKNRDITEYRWFHDWCPSHFAYLPVIGLALYLVAFSPGLGPMPWNINSEIYPLWARGSCTSIATSLNWMGNLIISFTFLTLTELLHTHGAFYLYAVFTLVGLFIFYLILPETRGKSLEQVESLFTTPFCCGATKDDLNTSQELKYDP